MSSERDARKRLNAGNFEVRGYIGEFSYREINKEFVCDEECDLFEPLCEIVERIDDAVVVDCLIFIDRVIATTCTQDAVDQFCLSSCCALGESVEKVLGG